MAVCVEFALDFGRQVVQVWKTYREALACRVALARR